MSVFQPGHPRKLRDARVDFRDRAAAEEEARRKVAALAAILAFAGDRVRVRAFIDALPAAAFHNPYLLADAFAAEVERLAGPAAPAPSADPEPAIAPECSGGYICQFCGARSLVSEWRRGGHECPKCGRLYDAIMAQDSEE